MEMYLFIGWVLKIECSHYVSATNLKLLFKWSLAGVSRSTTIAISYIMTITELPW